MSIEEQFINLYSFDQKKYSEIEFELRLTREQVQDLYRKTRYRTEYIQSIRNKFKVERRIDFNEDFRKFFEWYEGQKQECGYCGISQKDLHLIFQEERLLPLNESVKRSSGTLEIERKDSAINSYEDSNIILACPLCNNAKSNLVDRKSWETMFAPVMRQY